MKGRVEELSRAIEGLKVHDHLCLIYTTREEQFAAVVPFMRSGLERGERCVYIADDNTASVVIGAMRAGGIDAPGALASGALVVATKRDAYLKDGFFDPDMMIRFLGDNVSRAVEEGYSALRVTGEMTWALGEDPGAERVMEYEAKLNYFFPKSRSLAICQYNMRRFRPEVILDVIKTHPLVIYGNTVCRNRYFVPPDEFLRPGQAAREVERLLGAMVSMECAEDELKRYKGRLEELVEERTRELNAANGRLREEIKARKRAEEVLRRSEEKYRIISENTHGWEFWIGPDGRYLYVSPSSERVSGRRREEFLADPGLRLRTIHPDDRAVFEEHIRSQERREPGELEYRIVRPDGGVRWIAHACQPVYSATGEFLGTRGSNRDVTERRLAEEELRESERKYRTLFDAMLNGFALHEVITGPDGRPRDYRFLEVNRAFEELTGLKREDLVGRTVLEALPATEQYWIDIYGSVALTGSPVRFENYSKELGKYFEVVSFSPRPGQFAAVFADITGRRLMEERLARYREELEVKVSSRTAELLRSNESLKNEVSTRMQAEEELRKAMAALERSNKELEEFAYVASHDLQEPLRMVSSFMQLLESRYKGRLDPEADSFINYAVDGAKRMHLLINDLLAYSRVTTRARGMQPVDMGAALKSAVENLRLSIEETGAVITHGELPVVEADEVQVIQLLQNLIGNAIKFRKPGEAPRIDVGAELAGGEWVFSVRDEGIGIEPAYWERVFVIFQRLHGKGFTGTGIGLAICKRIVERHNGRIWVASEPGRWTRFSFSMPARVEQRDRPAQRAGNDAP